MSELAGKTIAILGCGAMGSALGRGLVQAKAAEPRDIVFSDPHSTHISALQEQLGAVRSTASNHEAAEGADVIIVAVKPFNVRTVLEEIREFVSPQQLVVSIAAGLRISLMEEVLKAGVPVVRAMPNSAAQVNEGACALSPGTHATAQHLKVATKIFTSVGTAVQVQEHLLDAVTALSGSGPAYVYLMIEALVDGGVKVGLPRDVAHQLAVQTVLGSAKMVFETGKHPAQLKDIVATPGGTTITALAALEKAGVRAALIDAVEKACNRAKELGAQ
jgi:pyrroline-5-carboxylate reductase